MHKDSYSKLPYPEVYVQAIMEEYDKSMDNNKIIIIKEKVEIFVG